MHPRFIFYFIFFFVSQLIFSSEDSCKYINTDAGKVYYEIEGKGDSYVFFLSGGPGAPVESLKPIIDYVSKSNKCILLHQRGTGKSKNVKVDSSSITLNSYIGDILNVLEKEKISNTYFVGHSWGAMLALDFVTKFPNKTTGLILIGSPGASLDFVNNMNSSIMERLTKEEMDSVQMFFQQLNAPEDENSKKEISSKLNNIFLSKQFYNPSLAFNIINMEPMNMDVNAIIMKNLFNINWNLEKDLQNIRVPIVIINGGNDPIGVEPVRKINDIVKNSNLHLINNCGHYVWLEKPLELKEIIMCFLKNNE